VFKARDKKNLKRMVAMKKILMENEKEGVNQYFFAFYELDLIINNSYILVLYHHLLEKII